MNVRTASYVLMMIGVISLVSLWGRITRAVNADVSADAQEVTQWVASGSPQADRLHARQFMHDVAEEAAVDPDVDPIQANLHFSGSGNKESVVYASFLAGNPPDTVNLRINQLDDYVAAGLIRPLDDLLAREERIRERRGLPSFVETRLGGELELLRYVVNPEDWRIRRWREDGSFAREAANLLNMHGKLVGFTEMGFCRTLTWNKRLFRECAGAGDRYRVLLDDAGEPRPPRTWRELRLFARLISEWGRETFGEDAQERPYGLVMQGQRPRDFMRAIDPLAATAGSRGFDFHGEAWLPSRPDQPVGRFDYHDPAYLGALKLMLLIYQDGSVLPGTLERFYEEPRVLLAKGRAAMLIDGWHAALIGCQNVPSARAHIASAAVPTPYTEGDEKERQALQTMLDMPIRLGQNFRDMGTGIKAITTGSRHPEAMWDWLYRNDRDPTNSMEAILSHYVIPGNRLLAHLVYESQEPRWKAFREKMLPFQFQVWPVIEATRIWPLEPVHGHVDVDNHYAVLHDAFKATKQLGDAADRTAIETIVEQAGAGLERYTDAVNADLARRIEAGIVDPAGFTFDDWDPSDPQRFFLRQRQGRGVDDATITGLHDEMPARYRDDIAMIRPASAPLLLAIVGMMLITVAGYVAWTWAARGGRSGLAATGHQARRHWHAYAFIAPALIALFVFVLFPAAYSVYLSFHSGTGQTAMRFVGFENYTRSFADGMFLSTVIPNTMLYMVIVACGEVVLGLLLACLLNVSLRGMALFRTMMFIPLVVSMAVVAVIFYGLLQGDDSTLNVLLEGIGFYGPDDERIKWLTDERYALFTVMGIAIWHGLPYNIILCLAGLQSIPKDLYEAARIDGAGLLARFTRITLPQLTPILLIIVFNSLVGAARHFGTVFILTEGEYDTEIVSTYIYKTAFFSSETQVGDVGYAATLSILYALLLAGLVVINVIYVSKRMRRRLAQGERED